MSNEETLLKRALSPFWLTIIVYCAFFLLVFTKFYELYRWELANLGLRIVGFLPSMHTILIYVFGGLSLVWSYIIFEKLFRKRFQNTFLTVIREKVSYDEIWFYLFSLGFLMSILANLYQLYVLRTIPLFDIAARWKESPVIVWFATLQFIFVPGMLVMSKKKWQACLAWMAFFIGVVGLALLGARNLPAKLVVAFFLAIVYKISAKQLKLLLLVFLIIFILSLGVVGAISKQGIYKAKSSAGLAIALTYSDSASIIYNLERIIKICGPTGAFKGKLLEDSFFALIPGEPAEYANYQIGKLLQGRSYFEINNEVIERSVSLAPSLVGAAYADFGVIGIFVQMLILGLLFAYFSWAASLEPLYLPFSVNYAAYVINGVDAGIHNPHFIAVFIASFALFCLDVLINGLRRRNR